MLEQKSNRGTVFGDYDNDGDIDIPVISNDEGPALLRNDTAGGRWITVRPEGTASNRTPSARVTLEAGGLNQTVEIRRGGSYISHNYVRAHFGLGDARQVDRLFIRRPNG